MKVREARSHLPFVICVTLWLICSGNFLLMAQVDRGAITGTVTDASGAVMGGVTVIITNTETNQANRYATNDSGGFVANLLRIGKYTVTAEKSGFQKTVQENVEVGVNQVVRVDLRMQVGVVTQTVEVGAAPSLIQTETTSLGTIETERRIVTLPLNERNFIALAYLGPGANSGQQGTNASGGVFENERGNEALSVNGLRVSNNNFLLDGVDNNEFGLGGTIVLPPPDAIQEFRIEENSMSAEFGRGGAAVNVALKSGTNEVHGGAYEFLRNDKLDARNYFDVEKPPFHRNQFGALLGGPIIKDRTFIFGDYQGVRIRQGLTFVSTVPTESMRGGDFSELQTPIYDPASTGSMRQLINPTNPFVIPTNRINAVGQAIVQLYPLPNRPGAGLFDNFVLNPKLMNNQNAFDIRVDHRFREQDQVFGHYSFSNVDSLRPAPLGDVGGQDCCPSNSTNRAQHLGLGWTHTFQSNLLNDLHGGAFRYVVNGLPLNYGKDISQGLGIPNANRGDPTSSGLSFIEVSGFQSLGDSLWTPEFAVENIFQIADTLSWVRGKHSLKFGVDFRRQQRNFFQTTAPRGWFQFTGAYTQDPASGTGGNGLADLLLGIPQFLEQDTLAGKYPTRYWDLAGFVQDDVHVTPDLTLNLGLRYEVFSPASGRIGNFDLQTAKVVNAQGPNGVPHAGVKFDKNNWGPRVGVAWTPFGNKRTVLRGAFGVFYSTEGNIFDDLGLSPPYLSVESQFFNGGIAPDPSQSVSNGFPATVTFPDPNFPQGTVRTNGPEHTIPYILEWNLNIQRDFGRNWVAQIAYVGTRGVRLWNHESTNLNQPPRPLDSNFSDETGNFGRPYFDRLPNLDTVLPFNFPQLSMLYHSLQTSLTKRFSNGLNLQASYTFGKNLGTADGNVGTVAIQNAYNVAAEKGPVPPDLRHRFVVSYLYELPIGRGKPFLGHASPLLEAVFGGWQISGITLWRSGEAYTAGLSFDPTNTGSNSPRPDRIHDPYDFSFDIATQAALGCSSPGHQTLDCFYNQAAFVLSPLAPGQTFAHVFGNSGRSTLRGPDQRNFDLAILKKFHVTEHHALEFRTEFFNLSNTPQFALPDGTVDVPGGASISSTLPDNQREIQLGLKWTF
ncbi:MAG: hypothetical protein DMG89_20205 [Acidobacteria bacterium]|nr:MAG: hypothetical protein DMG89_20205 [Acidobacteriota bacterium]